MSLKDSPSMKPILLSLAAFSMICLSINAFSQVSRYSKPFNVSPPSSTIDFNQLDQTLSTLQDRYDRNFIIIQEKVDDCQDMIQLVKNYDNQSASAYQKRLNHIIDIINGDKKVKYSDGTIVENDISNKSFFNYVTRQLDYLQGKMSNRQQ